MTDLLRAVGGGDRRAFDDLYRRTAPRVYGLVKRLLRDPAQSEEVTQEIYLEIWQTAARFEAGKGSALGWMLTMAHRRAVDRVRASQASRERDLRVGIRDFEPTTPDVLESVSVHIESDRVKQAMSRISSLQREAIELAYFGGLSHTELAARIGAPVGTVKTRMRDGLIRLRAELTISTS